MKEYKHILTGYLASGNGGSWWMDEKNTGFLSPIIINKMTINAKIGDEIIVEQDSHGFTKKVHVNGKLAFEEV
jgi:hypothetical protein